MYISIGNTRNSDYKLMCSCTKQSQVVRLPKAVAFPVTAIMFYT